MRLQHLGEFQKQCADDPIDHGNRRESFNRREGAPVDVMGGIGQLGHGDHRQQRGFLDHREGNVGAGREYIGVKLRKNDTTHVEPVFQPQSLGRIKLTL